jgi:uncharacterized protein (TIGR02145 family)
LLPAVLSTTNSTICATQLPYSWNGLTIYEAGSQTVTLSSANGCDSLATLNLIVTPTTAPTFSQLGPYLSGATIPALPTTSNNSITGTWSPAINNTTTKTYTFTPIVGQCATTTTITITINEPLQYTLTASDNSVCAGTMVTLSVNLPNNISSVTDVDDNTYPTVHIGTQLWMQENLRSTKYSDGTDIPLVTDNSEWDSNYNNGTTLPMMCWYDNDQATYTANKFGALYNWYAVSPSTNGNKNICPTGWHVPSDAEWTVLTDYLGGAGYLGGSGVAGGKMKSTQYWESPNYDATNESGFSGLPGGSRQNGGTFNAIGYGGYWWSSTESGSYSPTTNFAYGRYLGSNDSNVYNFDSGEQAGFSVRCIKD